MKPCPKTKNGRHDWRARRRPATAVDPAQIIVRCDACGILKPEADPEEYDPSRD